MKRIQASAALFISLLALIVSLSGVTLADHKPMKSAPRHGLIERDAKDPYGTLTLANKTRDNKPPERRPAINWWANNKWVWQTGFDVGGNDDFVLLYHRHPEGSLDLMYATNERYPRLGIGQNGPQAQLDVLGFDRKIPTLRVTDRDQEGISARFDALNENDEAELTAAVRSNGIVVATNGFGAGNTYPTDQLGSLIRALPVTDMEGNRLGVVPIYEP